MEWFISLTERGSSGLRGRQAQAAAAHTDPQDRHGVGRMGTPKEGSERGNRAGCPGRQGGFVLRLMASEST